MPLANRFGHFVHVERPLGNQDDIRAARDAAVQGNPACIASHDFNDHDTVVSFSGRVDAVNRLAHNVAGRIESESVVRPAQIVVDRLRDADHFDSVFVKLLRHRQRVIAADRNQGVNLVLFDRCGAPLNSIRSL